MLVVLSEINCLKSLNKYGVYPDEFYTDFDLFRSNSLLWKNSTIMIICAGNCHFNKHLVVELVKTLSSRITSATDNSVNKLYVITDVSLPELKSYYKYENNLDKMDVMQRWNVVKRGVDIWSDLRCEERETVMHLSKFDAGVFDKSSANYSADDEYISLIKLPKLEF